MHKYQIGQPVKCFEKIRDKDSKSYGKQEYSTHIIAQFNDEFYELAKIHEKRHESELIPDKEKELEIFYNNHC